ncbi:MAG TPA: hypothetical protein DC006_04790 [Prevotellaceae bacterium]|nr:hypothetical protein [Prevotellaceae bacterium]
MVHDGIAQALFLPVVLWGERHSAVRRPSQRHASGIAAACVRHRTALPQDSTPPQPYNSKDENMKETIESKVAQAILQQADEVTVRGITYRVEQPTLATLAMLSELVSTLPDYDMGQSVIANVLAHAGQAAGTLARIAALLILGAARVRECRTATLETTTMHRRWSWRRMRRTDTPLVERRRVSEYDRLAHDLEQGTSPADINSIITKRLCDMQVGDFFAVTASLKGQDILAATREAGETASGE